MSTKVLGVDKEAAVIAMLRLTGTVPNNFEKIHNRA